MESTLAPMLSSVLPGAWQALAGGAVVAGLLMLAGSVRRSSAGSALRLALVAMLWLWMALVIAGAFLYAPKAEGFIGESSRILFFHVPMAWVAFLGFLAAGVWSLIYLFGGRQAKHDRSAATAVELGLVFCILATVTGSMWAKTMWGAFWNWDPRQISIILVLLFYAAYLSLRQAVEDPERRGRLAAVYAILGIVIAPLLTFIIPRLYFSLHPDSVINTRGSIDMESRMLWVLVCSWVGFQAVYFWLHRLVCRMKTLEARRWASE